MLSFKVCRKLMLYKKRMEERFYLHVTRDPLCLYLNEPDLLLLASYLGMPNCFQWFMYMDFASLLVIEWPRFRPLVDEDILPCKIMM